MKLNEKALYLKPEVQVKKGRKPPFGRFHDTWFKEAVRCSQCDALIAYRLRAGKRNFCNLTCYNGFHGTNWER